jgi:hypothetical protein
MRKGKFGGANAKPGGKRRLSLAPHIHIDKNRYVIYLLSDGFKAITAYE